MTEWNPHPHQQPSNMGNANPILILGIFIFICPFFKHIINLPIPQFIYTLISILGVLLMVVGGILSIISSSVNR